MILARHSETGWDIFPDNSDKQQLVDDGYVIALVSNDDMRTLRKLIGDHLDSLPPTPLPNLAEVTDKDLVEACIAVRDKKEAAGKKADAKAKMFDERLDLIGAEILKRCKERETDSMRVGGVGTASIGKSTVYSCSNWEKFYEFLFDKMMLGPEEGGLSLMDGFAHLHKRVSTGPLDGFMAANEGAVPPGIDATSKISVTVRRSTKKE